MKKYDGSPAWTLSKRPSSNTEPRNPMMHRLLTTL